jgi:hypothetical protein
MFEESTKEYIRQIRDSGPSALNYLHELNESLQSSNEIYEECVKTLGVKHLLTLAFDSLIALKLEGLERYTGAIERFKRVISMSEVVRTKSADTQLSLPNEQLVPLNSRLRLNQGHQEALETFQSVSGVEYQSSMKHVRC